MVIWLCDIGVRPELANRPLSFQRAHAARQGAASRSNIVVPPPSSSTTTTSADVSTASSTTTSTSTTLATVADDDEIPPPPEDEPPPEPEMKFEIKIKPRTKSAAPTGPLGRGYVRHFGSKGSGPGQFDRPMGMALDQTGTLLYIADMNNHRIQVVRTSDGSFVNQWGKEGQGPGEFDSPSTVGVDEMGLVFVADRAERVQVFHSDGSFLAQFGSPGKGDTEFEYPRINIDSKGTVYVADHFNGTLLTASPSIISFPLLV
jgi:DNA-binding beta-propeller fold protein YncE